MEKDKKLGMVTIGQAPRTDVTPILLKHLGDRVELLQMGVLDGMEREEIDERLFPEEGHELLVSRLQSGESVQLSREKIEPIMQQKLNELENRGCDQILVLCTGVFHGFTLNKAYLIEPDRILPPTINAIVGRRKLGVVTPLADQREQTLEKWEGNGISPVVVAVSPYDKEREGFYHGAKQLVDQGAEIILLDCMGYVEECRRIVQEASGLPVILSNALMAKLISEML